MKQLVLFISLFLGSFLPGALPIKDEQPTLGDFVTIEIRYYAPEAGVVYFAWGINDWQPVPEELRMEDSIIEDNLMLMPMRRDDETFVAEVRVPAGANVQYGFSIKETASGRSVDVWDSGKDPELDSLPGQPVLKADHDKAYNVHAAVNSDATFINQTFRYRHPEASEVMLVWGINGWKPVPEAANVAYTAIHDNRMHSQMIRIGDNFQISIQVPKGSIIQYGFAYKEQEDLVGTWLGGYSRIADEDGSIEVIDFQNAPTQTVADDSAANEPPRFWSLLSEHWPLLLVAVIMTVGILIGFRK